MSRQPHPSPAVRWENWSARGALYSFAAGPMGGPLVSAAFSDAAGRVAVSVGGVPAGATAVHFERSINSITWSDVRGGQAVVVVGSLASIYDYEYADGVTNYYRATFLNSLGGIMSRSVGSVTPAQTGVWLKNPVRPYLNTKVTVVDFAAVTRKSRSGVFDIIGRTNAVAVTDLMSGRGTSITLRTTSHATADTLDLMIAVGEVLFLQPPYQAAPPTMYAVPGDASRGRVAMGSAVRVFDLPLTEVAQPDLTLAAVQSTWQTVINTYATWNDLIAAKATWADVLNLVGSAADVITS